MKSQETLLKSRNFCAFSRQLTQFLSHGELRGVFEETYKYNTSVDNNTLFIYKNSIFCQGDILYIYYFCI